MDVDDGLRVVHKYFDKKYVIAKLVTKKGCKRLIHLNGTINPISVKYLGKWACFL